MTTKKKIEVFSAGCSTCKETIELVKRIAGSSHDVVIHDMHESEIASKAKNYGVRSVPALVVDGKLAGCCAGRGPDEHVLRSALAQTWKESIIVSTFGPEGPTKCSGLDVMRYDADSLHNQFGARFRLVESSHELHETPFGIRQQFLYRYCRVE